MKDYQILRCYYDPKDWVIKYESDNKLIVIVGEVKEYKKTTPIEKVMTKSEFKKARIKNKIGDLFK